MTVTTERDYCWQIHVRGESVLLATNVRCVLSAKALPRVFPRTEKYKSRFSKHTHYDLNPRYCECSLHCTSIRRERRARTRIHTHTHTHKYKIPILLKFIANRAYHQRNKIRNAIE
jgi:hypothetical protein